MKIEYILNNFKFHIEKIIFFNKNNIYIGFESYIKKIKYS